MNKNTLVCRRIKRQFSLRAESFDNSAQWVKDARLLDIHQELAKGRNKNLILDACCGTGLVGERLSGVASVIIGLDISLCMLAKAATRLSHCVNGEIGRLPFPDNTFDIIVCRQAFHFLEIKRAIKEAFRVNKPGGAIIISQIVPFGKEDSDWLRKIHTKKQPLLNNFLNENNLKQLLRKSGYQDIESKDYHSEESINRWLDDPSIPKGTQEQIKEMFLTAPAAYKAMHNTRVDNGDILDTMRWVIIRGMKK